jgi:ABC-type multidrug transport system permease subunit
VVYFIDITVYKGFRVARNLWLLAFCVAALLGGFGSSMSFHYEHHIVAFIILIMTFSCGWYINLKLEESDRLW